MELLKRIHNSALLVFMVLSLIISALIINASAANTVDTWDGTSVATGYQSGSGTSGDPYIIANCAQLAYLRNQVNTTSSVAYGTYFKLASGVTFDLNGKSWVPIGTSSSYSFRGNFDGNAGSGTVIQGLSITGTNQYSGLFGYTMDSHFTGVTISAPNVSGGQCTGALIGYFGETLTSGIVYEPWIQNCSIVGGTITGNSSFVGGLVGRIGDASGNNYRPMQVNDCNTSCSVVVNAASSQNNIGGLIGCLHTRAGATVQNCYATGDVSAANGGSCVGGLIGYADNAGNTGTTASPIIIHDCYATGAVNAGNSSSGNSIGGLLGQIYEGSNLTLVSQVYNCYATGNVTGYKSTGGLIGTVSAQGNSVTIAVQYVHAAGTVIGSYATSDGGIGGIVGYYNCNNTSSTLDLSNAVALNYSVETTTINVPGTINRVLGSYSGSPATLNAYGYANMLVGKIAEQPITRTSSLTNSSDGQNITIDDINTAATWSDTFFSAASGWSYANGKLPKLAATTVSAQPPMPSHLKKYCEVTGTVSGLADNSGITVNYSGIINGSVTTATGGSYSIPNVPYGENITISVGSVQYYKTPNIISINGIVTDTANQNFAYAANYTVTLSKISTSATKDKSGLGTIRFITKISGLSGDVPTVKEFGTYIVPLSLFTSGQYDNTANVFYDNSDGSYTDQIKDGVTYSADLTNIPAEYSGTPIIAISYVKLSNGDTIIAVIGSTTVDESIVR